MSSFALTLWIINEFLKIVISNKGLEVTIKAKIERELTQVAVGKQSKPSNVVNPATMGGRNKPPKKKGGGKKKK